MPESTALADGAGGNWSHGNCSAGSQVLFDTVCEAGPPAGHECVHPGACVRTCSDGGGCTSAFEQPNASCAACDKGRFQELAGRDAHGAACKDCPSAWYQDSFMQ